MPGSGFCGKCETFYTRKENGLKHFKQQHHRTGGSGYAANICYDPEGKYKKTRVFEETLEKAVQRHKEVVRSLNYFKSVKSRPSLRSLVPPQDPRSRRID